MYILYFPVVTHADKGTNFSTTLSDCYYLLSTGNLISAFDYY